MQFKWSSNSKPTKIPNVYWSFFKIPLPQVEYKFHPIRKWRIDYAWPDVKVALEIEGGIWKGGRHVRPKGYLKDMEKYNSMIMHGWLLLRFAPNNIDYRQIKEAIEYRKIIK